ncbi:putative DUTPase Dut [Rhodotorula toruloides ATCC 204091]|uniref:Deoxyuridine 5'-triphosphate nucleotidohydrolase n=1 Tax=Rhodotorula toruloides TaxID=5286 RepID=A0A0K3C3K0_RHOTO|nr:putative DUTPase Dut [Rhodotorula toruloides ATCC 204091]
MTISDRPKQSTASSDPPSASLSEGELLALLLVDAACSLRVDDDTLCLLPFTELTRDCCMKRTFPPPANTASTTAEPPAKRPAMSTTASSSPASFLVQRLSDSATVPTRGSSYAAGYDLYSAEDKTVPAQGKALISTGLAIAVPEGTYGRVAPRSGLAAIASKHMIDTGAGVIDADYRGEVKVLLFNHAKEDFQISTGDRIAQLILERIVTPEPVEVSSLTETARGAGGFGSTGGFGVSEKVLEAAKVLEAEKEVAASSN